MGVDNLLAPVIDGVTNAVENAVQNDNGLRNQTTSAIIGDINSSNQLTIFEKQVVTEAVIRNANQLKKENIEDILSRANSILVSKNLQILNGIEKVNTNWMLEFLDNCENTTDADMKEIWAKILSSECETPGSVSKRLLGILRIIDKNVAEIFGKICSHTVILQCPYGEKSMQFIIPYLRATSYNNKIIDDFITKLGFTSNGITELENLGLIDYCYAGYVYECNEMVVDYYGDKLLLKPSGKNKTYIDAGQYQYSRYGLELARILYEDKACEKDVGYIDFLAEYLSTERKNEVQRI